MSDEQKMMNDEGMEEVVVGHYTLVPAGISWDRKDNCTTVLGQSIQSVPKA